MEEFQQQDGVSFLILFFTARDEVWLMPFEELKVYWDRMLAGGRKSFTYEEMRKEYPVQRTPEVPLHYLKALERYVNRS